MTHPILHPVDEPTPGHNPDAEMARPAPSWDEDAAAKIAAYIADPVLFRTRRVIGEQG